MVTVTGGGGGGFADRPSNVVERYLEAIASHDWEAFAATLADDGFSRT